MCLDAREASYRTPAAAAVIATGIAACGDPAPAECLVRAGQQHIQAWCESGRPVRRFWRCGRGESLRHDGRLCCCV